MSWKVGLDRYLTTSPDDGFDDWCDDVLGNKLTDTFYNENEKWVDEYDGKCNTWLNELFKRGKNTTEAARIIERAFSLLLDND